MTQKLTHDDIAMLNVEKARWLYPGAKSQFVLETFGLTMTRFYQRVNALIDTEAALAHDPHTVNRLRRQREARQRHRAAVRATFVI